MSTYIKKEDFNLRNQKVLPWPTAIALRLTRFSVPLHLEPHVCTEHEEVTNEYIQ